MRAGTFIPGMSEVLVLECPRREPEEGGRKRGVTGRRVANRASLLRST